MRLIAATAFALAAAFYCGVPGTAFAQDDTSEPGSAAFYNGDSPGAMDVWRPKADGGDPEAMTNVGMLYNLGLGVKRDYKEAAAWYEKAAQLGFVLAQFDLGNLYYDGQGVARDRKQAARWYLAAAKGGSPKAQLYLAQMYESGEGVEKNKETALGWYQKAADLELADAQYELGRKLVFGDGIEPDPVKGPDLVLKAAEHKFVKAQILMADCYWRGRGVPKNPIEAYVWASQAVELAKNQDSKRAQSLFDDIKSGMNGDQIKAAEIELLAVNPKKKKDTTVDQNGGDTSAPQ